MKKLSWAQLVSPLWLCEFHLCGRGLLCSLCVGFSIPPVSPAPWVHVSAFTRDWNSTGSLLSDWHLWMLPVQGGHGGDVAGHHCQMTAQSTCWLGSLQTGSRNRHGPFSSYCLVLCSLVVSLYLVPSPETISLLCQPLSSLVTPSSSLGGKRWMSKDLRTKLAYVIHPRPGARPSRTLLLKWR